MGSAIADDLALRVTEADAGDLARNAAACKQGRRAADRLMDGPKSEARFCAEGQRVSAQVRQVATSIVP